MRGGFFSPPEPTCSFFFFFPMGGVILLLPHLGRYGTDVTLEMATVGPLYGSRVDKKHVGVADPSTPFGEGLSAWNGSVQLQIEVRWEGGRGDGSSRILCSEGGWGGVGFFFCMVSLSLKNSYSLFVFLSSFDAR